jgi:hypothetical protein
MHNRHMTPVLLRRAQRREGVSEWGWGPMRSHEGELTHEASQGWIYES